MASLSAWNDAEDELLRTLFAKGETFSQIAQVISRSRNATIGRAHRLGLSGRKVVFTPAQRRENSKNAMARNNIARKAKRAQNPIKVLRRNGGTITAMATFEQEAFKMRLADVEPMYVALVDLAPGGCRYPYGDGPFTFCGCQALKELPYCAPHHRLTHSVGERQSPEEIKSAKRAFQAKLVAEVVAA